MAIEFHCHHCGHHVRTTDENAGKYGKCPHCHQSVYIPTPSDAIEPLRLAPVDEADARERQRLIDEARNIARRLREEGGELPPEPPKAARPEPVGDARLTPDMETLIVEYVLAMVNGKLDEAEQYARDIHADRNRANEVLQRLRLDELPPARLAKVPRAVLLGFLKQLQK